MADQLLLRSDLGGVTTLTLNQPERFNALSEAMLDALSEQLSAIENDRSVRVVVLAASGKAFCAGHDLREMQPHTEESYFQTLFQRCCRLMMRLQKLPQPVIARVQGLSTAAGCQLVAMCDLAVAADSARFAVSGIQLGLFCATPGVALSRNLSRKRALEMLLTGEFIDAEEALQAGLLNRVVAAEALDSEIAALCAAIVSKPEAAVRLGKALFYKQSEMGIEAAYQLAARTMALNIMEPSAREGIQAFLEKRRPDWAGLS